VGEISKMQAELRLSPHAKPLIFGIPHPPRALPYILRLLPYTNDIPKQNKIIACLKHVPEVTTCLNPPFPPSSPNLLFQEENV
jgi:hypothetical protein